MSFAWKVELGSKAGALKQMLLDILEDPHEIRRICIMGRNCTLRKDSSDMECSVPLEKQIAEGKSFTYFIFFFYLFLFTLVKIVHLEERKWQLNFLHIYCWIDVLSYLQKRRKKLKCFWKTIFKGYFFVPLAVCAKHIVYRYIDCCSHGGFYDLMLEP